MKPKVVFVGENGNVYNLIGIARRALKAAGLRDKADELTSRCFLANSYAEALAIIQEYVEVE